MYQSSLAIRIFVSSAIFFTETAEKTFDFACHARYWFANGDRQTKREILAGLGSNLELYDRSVRINLEKPLQFIELAMEEEPTISEMFEPKESIDNMVQIESLWAQNPTLLERWYEFGRIDWVGELEYPEWTNKEVNRFLQA